jgi:quercetin dioxygenase-like cupin family protein
MGDSSDRPASPARAPNGQLSTLPQLHRFITGHDASGKAIVHSHNDFHWKPYDSNQLAFSVAYTTSEFPPDLNNDKDVTTHHEVLESGNLGLVNPKGSVLRCVDFAPGYACGMHRTQSLDYGIVLEGEVDMVLDSGERHRMRRGDVAVQRATQHQWVNRSETEWARMMFVLQDCKPLVVAGEEYGEDLGTNSGLPASGN